jgi:gamma-glutamyltranspeptidase / glutathione hydrolase
MSTLFDSPTGVFERLLGQNATASGSKVVTAASANAATAGIAMFAAGGNAFDAALAACFVETVSLPMKCGLAGDVVALFEEDDGALNSLVSVGLGCAALANGAALQVTGPCSVGVPGAPDGYAELAKRARLPLSRLIEPALDAARNGVVWTQSMRGYLRQSLELLERYSPDCPYLAHGLPAVNQRMKLPGLVEVLEEYVARGAAMFEGPMGAAIVDRVRTLGGFLGMEDFKMRSARLYAPEMATLPGGQRLYATPRPTQGPALIDAIGRHLSTGQPLFDAVADARRVHRADDEGTSVVIAADGRSTVVVVHSNSYPRFGSGVVLPNGLVLNNRPGRGFRLDAPPGAAGAPSAGVAPPTTLHAWALDSDRTRIFGATPGGVNQLPWNAQTVAALIESGDESDDADALTSLATAPRWAVDDTGTQICEANLDGSLRKHSSRMVEPMSLGSAQQVVVLDKAEGERCYRAVADPRNLSSALALP